MPDAAIVVALLIVVMPAVIVGMGIYCFKLRRKLKVYEPIIDVEERRAALELEFEVLKGSYKQKKEIHDKLHEQVAIYENKIEMIESGLADPVFEYDDPDDYKQKILDVRSRQKDLVQDKVAAVCSTEWVVNGSRRDGKKLANSNVKVMLRAFNNECDTIIRGVSWRNYVASQEKLDKAFEFFNKHSEAMNLRLQVSYLQLKKEELRLVYERQEKLKQIKDEQRELRELQREEEKFEKERIAAAAEEEKYRKLLDKANQEVLRASGEKVQALNAEIEKLTALLQEAQEKNQRAISMAQQTRAGYVYVISNIGSFGEDVFKIGMTRRLEPLERVRELGDASVPFEFDVHALIASTDAPSLERQLHTLFDREKINLINNRREFFRVNIENLESIVRGVAPDVDFVRTPQAEQFRKSEAMRQAREPQLVSARPLEAFPDSL